MIPSPQGRQPMPYFASSEGEGQGLPILLPSKEKRNDLKGDRSERRPSLPPPLIILNTENPTCTTSCIAPAGAAITTAACDIPPVTSSHCDDYEGNRGEAEEGPAALLNNVVSHALMEGTITTAAPAIGDDCGDPNMEASSLPATIISACEECEVNVAILRCNGNSCQETLCERCCLALHPSSISGEHDHYSEGMIRPLLPSDPPGYQKLVLGVQPPSDWPITTEDRQREGLDVAVAHSMEAPAMNLVRTKAAGSSSSRPRFREGDVVVFAVNPSDEMDPGDEDHDDYHLPQGAKPDWRGIMGQGLVIGTANGDSTTTTTTLSTENFQNVYVIGVRGYVIGDFSVLAREQRKASTIDKY